MSLRALATTTVTLLALAGLAHAQSCPQTTKLIDAAAFPLGWFGNSLALSFGGLNATPLLVVGEPGKDFSAGDDNRGGFTVYQYNGNWIQTFALTNISGQDNERLGWSVGLADPYLIAGSPSYSSGEGRARIYRRPANGSGYVLEANLLPPVSGGAGQFGTAVAVSSYGGGWAAVGAPLHSSSINEAGAVFFYKRTDISGVWSPIFELTGAGADGAGTFEHRGLSVAISQTTPFAAVGSPQGEAPGLPADHGIVTIVERPAGGQPFGPVTVLQPPNAEAGEHFGTSVAIEGSLLVVGAPDEDMSLLEGGLLLQTAGSGAIYIFERVNGVWTQTAKRRSTVPTASASFGRAVSTDGVRIIASEPGTHRAHIFQKVDGTWQHQASVIDPDAPATGGFGTSVALRDNAVAVGDWHDDHSGAIDPGAVYITSIDAAATVNDSCADAVPIYPTSADYHGCTSLATPSLINNATTCGTGADGQGNDVWFSFQPDCSGSAIFDTFGSTFDTVLSVHSTCPFSHTSTTIVCNDDASFAAPNDRASLVTFNFTAGETYLLRVTGYNQSHGEFTLRHSVYYPAHPHDTCQTALNLFTDQGTFLFNNCGATTDFSLPAACIYGPLHVPFLDIWYRWTASTNGPVSVDTCGSSQDTNLVVYPLSPLLSCPFPGSPVLGCSNDSVNFCVPGATSTAAHITFTGLAGQSYLIRVGSNYNTGGPGQLTIVQAPHCPADFNNDGVLDPDDLADYIGAYFALPPLPTADFNADQDINPDDLADFIGAYFAGCP